MEPGDTITLCRYVNIEYKDQYGIKHSGYREVDVYECIIMSWFKQPHGFQAIAKAETDGLIFSTNYEGLNIGDEDIWYCDGKSGFWRRGLRDTFAGLAVVKGGLRLPDKQERDEVLEGLIHDLKGKPLPPGEEGKVLEGSGVPNWETTEQQIKKLADFILNSYPGEPSQNQGAVDTAIRLLAKPLPSEAIIVFCGWLTSRKETVCLGADHDAANIVPLYEKFLEANELREPREGFELTLRHPEGE